MNSITTRTYEFMLTNMNSYVDTNSYIHTGIKIELYIKIECINFLC
jgi:hypothetical protein